MQLALLQADALQSGISSFFLWIATGGMIFGTVAFLWLATSGGSQNYHHYVTSAVITLWAAMMYIVMSTGSGIATVVGDEGTRLFYYARYVDWVITTPLLLLGLSWVAMRSINRDPRLIGIIILSDVVMILTGLISGWTNGGLKWFFFVISCIAFVAVLYCIWVPLRAIAASGVSPEASLFFPLASMLTVLWILYPVVFLLGTEGAGAVSAGAEVFFYAVLDILAKVAFGFILLGGIRRIYNEGRARSA